MTRRQAHSFDVLVLFNEPMLPADDPDWASEAGVLESVEAVENALLARGHRVRRFGVGATVGEFLDRFGSVAPPDVVFNLFEGFGGVGRGEAEIAGLVELLGYPLTGSPAGCLQLVRDKARTKWLLAGAGLPTAPFALVAATDPLEPRAWDDLLAGGPVIVKPAHEDASLGIGPESIVSEPVALMGQIVQVRDRYGAVLVERFVAGREFNVAVLATPEPELLPLAEIEFSAAGDPGWQIVTYDAKWAIGSEADRATPARCPAVVEPPLAERISQVALAAFRLTGCRQYVRVDVRVDQQGEVYVLEINGNPDIGPGAGYARALRAAAIEYEEFVDRLVQDAVNGREQPGGSPGQAQLSTRR